TTGNIATDTTLVEGTHCQLGTRLTNGLSSNNTDGFADIDQVAGSHGLAVALRTNTGWGLAGQNRANLNFSDASVNQLVSQFFSQICASLSDDVAFSILDIGCNNEIGRASCRERRWTSADAASLMKIQRVGDD